MMNFQKYASHLFLSKVEHGVMSVTFAIQSKSSDLTQPVESLTKRQNA